MWITKIEQAKNKKYLVYADRNFLFALYGKELKRFHIEEETELSDDVIALILDQIVFKRAKERALYLLETKPYTSVMMRDKLKQNDYPIEIIDRVIVFLKKYHYIDDADYIRAFVNSYSHSKSRKAMRYALMQKGVDKDLLDSVLEEMVISEECCFEKQFMKYIKDKDLSDWKNRQKIFRYFVGKGFSYAMIEEYMQKVASV